MALEKDILATAYKADNLGDVKPKIVIGGQTAKFVPNLNLSFELQSGEEKYFINANRKSVTVGLETETLAAEKLSLSIGNETDIWHIDENGRLKWDIEFATKPATNVFEWEYVSGDLRISLYCSGGYWCIDVVHGVTLGARWTIENTTDCPTIGSSL
jgi:hypothetical protein